MSGHPSASVPRRHASLCPRARRGPVECILALTALIAAPSAHASLFSGDTLDFVANILAWVVLFIAPAIAIAVFWMVHILPERIAEKNHHPQVHAIKTLCMLSLFFGGLLWPLAWLWAYSKPVLYKLAYGTDVATPEEADEIATQEPVVEPAPEEPDPTGEGQSRPASPARRMRATH